MAHPDLDITPEQEANLRKLAAYLVTLPSDYPDFAMNDFTSTGGMYAVVPECGTAACAAGHGPLAGIAFEPGESWHRYSQRAFVQDYTATGEWDWCFSAAWSRRDNTAHGAARRILWMLDHGVPDDADDQRWGDAPLCYAPVSAEAA